MKKNSKTDIAELKTHIKYIRKHIDTLSDGMKNMNEKMDRIENVANESRINLTNHLSCHKRDLLLVTIFLSVVTFIINYMVK